MTFTYGIFSFICLGLSDSFVLHPPSRVNDEDASFDENGFLPVVSLSQPRSSDPDSSSHPNPNGQSVACNVSLCHAGLNALNNSCCGHHSTLLESWLGVFGLMAAVAIYAIIAYCYMRRRNHNHQLHNHSRGPTYADCSNYNSSNQHTPPPEYTGVLPFNDLPVDEAAPPTYDEAMSMTIEHQDSNVPREQNTKVLRVEKTGKRFTPGRYTKQISFEAIARRFTT